MSFKTGLDKFFYVSNPIYEGLNRRYLARGLNTKDKREIFDLCQELEDLIDEYNRVSFQHVLCGA